MEDNSLCSNKASLQFFVLLFLVDAGLKDASCCKTDEHESEDEELPEDEVDSKFR